MEEHHLPHMHHEVPIKIDRLTNLNKIELMVAIIMGLISLLAVFGSFYITPYRVSQLENRVSSLEQARQQDHDLLIEIRTNVKILIDKQDKASK